MADEPTTNGVLTLQQASDLVGDDIEYFVTNPFMPSDLIVEKVVWWVGRAVAAARAEGWQAAYDDLHETPARLTGPEVVEFVTAAVASARADERERIARQIAAQESCASPADTCYRDHDGCAVAESLRIARGDYPPGTPASPTSCACPTGQPTPSMRDRGFKPWTNHAPDCPTRLVVTYQVEP